MKKSISLLICLATAALPVLNAIADSRTAHGITNTEQLGITAGVAAACNANTEKIKNYEMIASRIIVNPTRSVQEEKEAVAEYARAKFNAYNEQKKHPQMDCKEVLKRFYKQPIFKSVVYRSGKVKLPDGTVIKPNRPLPKPASMRPKPVNKKASNKKK